MISIVIPVWNRHDMTTECIESIENNTTGYELIIVDNGSDPPINGAVVRNDSNLGYPVAVNQGIRASKGEIIVLLNNDVFVTPGWMDRMLRHLDKYDIVGPMSSYCLGIQKTVIQHYEDVQELYDRASKWSNRWDGQSQEVNWIVGFCFAFRRSLFDSIGEFDESLWPCSGEEIDFCLKAKKNGYKIGVARDVYVHHEGSQTFSEMEDEGIVDYAEVCERNKNHLISKWGKGVFDKQIIRQNGNGALRLNLGCGRFKMDGFVNIDINEAISPDIVGDVLSLPYAEGTIDEIYAGHILEHFNWKDGIGALQYWNRLLKEGGRIFVCVPDYDFLVGQYMRNPSPERLRVLNDTYIYSYKQDSPHKYAYNEALLKEVMQIAGYSKLKRMPQNHPYFAVPVEWQVGYEGTKP